MRTLDTVAAVFEEFGGINEIATATRSTYKAAHHWKTRGRFAKRTYPSLTKELTRRRIFAPDALWGMEE